MTPKPENVLVRGTPILGLCRFLEKELSAERLKEVYRGLPDPHSKRFASGSLLASERVPLSVVDLLTSLAAREKGESVEAFAERAGVAGAKEAISSIFRPFFRVLSVSNALEIAPLMWARIYDAGKIRVESKGKRAAIRVAEFPGGPAVCGRITGWFRYIAELSGARAIRLQHEACSAKGHPECVWEFDWE